VTTEAHTDSDFSLLAFSTLVLRHRWLFIRLPLLCGLILGVWALTRPRTYTASASFAGKASSTQSPLSGLASQFGIKVGGGESGYSPQFYAALVTSTATIGPLVDSARPWVPTRNGLKSIAALYKTKRKTPDAIREEAIGKFRGHVGVNSSRETGIINVTVSSPDPLASAALTNALVNTVSDFYLRTRQSGASAERKFVEGRLAEAKTDLRQAEDALRYFLERNRSFSNSPQLQFENHRLERDVQMRQEVVTTLAQSYEQARVDEVRNLPGINIIETPRVPTMPDARRTIMRTLTGVSLGLCLALLIGVLREVFRRDEQREAELSVEYERLKRQTRDEMKHPGTLLSRILGFNTRVVK
jgi:uncharacterized protein involved in exopolysaccharide biosynthesis